MGRCSKYGPIRCSLEAENLSPQRLAWSFIQSTDSFGQPVYFRNTSFPGIGGPGCWEPPCDWNLPLWPLSTPQTVQYKEVRVWTCLKKNLTQMSGKAWLKKFQRLCRVKPPGIQMGLTWRHRWMLHQTPIWACGLYSSSVTSAWL